MSETTPETLDVEPLLTPEEVCEWFRISKDLLYDMVQARKLPYMRIGGRQLRFRRSELESYLTDRHTEAEL